MYIVNVQMKAILFLLPLVLLPTLGQRFPPDINISEIKLPSLPQLHDLQRLAESWHRAENSACMDKLVSLALNYNSPDPVKALETIYFFDAIGKPPSGILTGNVIMPGNYDVCMSMKNTSLGYYDSCSITANALLGKVYPVTITWSGCLPLECRFGNATDVENELYTYLNKYLGNAIYMIPGEATRTCEGQVKWETGTYVAVTCMALVTILVVIGSLWELLEPLLVSCSGSPVEDLKVLVENEVAENVYEDIAPQTVQSHSVSPNGHVHGSNVINDEDHLTSRASAIGKFFKCFALQRTLSILTGTTTKPGTITCLNGIRVLSINWVVLGHVYMTISFFNATPAHSLKLMRRHNFGFVFNGLPSVDSFFTLSGFLVAFLLLKQLKNGMSAMKWVAYYVHRYFRLTVPYAMVILIEGFMYRVWGSGPFMSKSEVTHTRCKDNWWTNLLYINNFIPKIPGDVCIGQTWYLANDMQFFLIAPIFIILLFRKPLAGIVANLSTIVASMVTAATLTYVYNLGPSVDADTNVDKDFYTVYNKPYVRVTPYLIGILGGWIYWKYGQKLTAAVSRIALWKQVVVATLMWLVTATIQYFVVFGLYDDLIDTNIGHKLPSRVDSISYQSLARVGWALSLTVQILMCQCGLGGFINDLLSWRGWLILSRLTYSVYLIHLGLLNMLLYQTRQGLYGAPDYYVAILYLGVLVMSYLAASVLYVTLEQPVSSLETLTYRKPKKQ